MITSGKNLTPTVLPTAALLFGLCLVLLAPIPLHAQSIDLVFANNGQRNRVCLNDGVSNYTCADVSADAKSSLQAAVADVDGANGPDLVFANIGQENRVCLNDGTGSFTCADVSADVKNTTVVAVADIDGTNGIDLAFANNAQANQVCLNDGAGNFTCADISADTNGSYGVEVADVDGANGLDIVFGNEGGPNRVCLNDGAGNFTCSNVSAAGANSRGVVAVDVDGDTDLDVVFANAGPHPVCLNDGSGSFTCADVSADSDNGYDVAAGDVDGANGVDLVFANNGQENRVCLNDGSGSFTCSDVSADTDNTTGVEVTDLDGTNGLDLVFSNQGQANEACLNDGAGNFTCTDVSGDTNTSRGMAVGDVDAPINEITVVPAASLYWPLDVATVDLDVTGVDDLFAVSGDLGYPVALAIYDDASLAVGAFLDDGTTSSFENDDDAGVLSWSVGRTGAAGASGSGNAATTTFSVVDAAAPGTASFTLTDVSAVNPSGTPITLTPINGSFEIGGVWPGDADNNCTVEATDLLPVGVYFGETGPARTGYDLSWSAKAFSPWGGSSGAANFPQSFADTDGDGEIDEGDVLAFFVNYGETHAETTGCDDGIPKGQRSIRWALAPRAPGTAVTLALETASAEVLGAAFRLSVDASAYRIESIEAGGLLAGDLMEIVRVDAAAGTAQAAFTRKGLDAAARGAGTLATIRLTALSGDGAEVLLSDVKVSTAEGIGPAGTGVMLDASLAGDALDLPTAFVLHGAYPNPFNPSTTVSFDLPEQAQVRLVVIDLLGRVVQTADLGQVAAGANRQVQFSAAGLASGTYLYRLEAIGASSMTQTGRFVLLK